MKRAVDLVLATAGLLATAPLLAAIGLAIKLGDGGPIFFSQTRVGLHGRHFRIHKFRTMVIHAEQQGLQITSANDSRITAIGQWLRRTKLDELPQLWNVIKGDMSLVGPRPEVPRYVELYTAEQRRVLHVRPGITDPASIEFIDESQVLTENSSPEDLYINQLMPAKLVLNLQYVANVTTRGDAVVIAKTIWRVIHRAA